MFVYRSVNSCDTLLWAVRTNLIELDICGGSGTKTPASSRFSLTVPLSRTLNNLDPRRMMCFEDAAAAYLSLAWQPKSTWTHELDFWPNGEAF